MCALAFNLYVHEHFSSLSYAHYTAPVISDLSCLYLYICKEKALLLHVTILDRVQVAGTLRKWITSKTVIPKRNHHYNFLDVLKTNSLSIT